MNDSDRQYEEVPFDEFDIRFHVALYKRTVPVLFALITAVGLIGNCMVIIVILRKRHMRTTINLLLLNLAFCDVTFLTVCVPFVAYHYAADNWLIGDVMCKLTQFLLYVTVYVTVYILVVVSALRFMTIVHANASVKIRTKLNICILIAFIWAVMLVANTPILLMYRVKEYPAAGPEPYYYCASGGKESGQQLFLSFFVMAYLIPLLAIVTLYLLILRYLRKKRKQSLRLRTTRSNGSCGHAPDRTTHATRIVILVVAIFGACWLPLHIHLLLSYFGKIPDSHAYQVYRMLCHCLAYANSCLNPFVYNYASKDFRNSFKNLFPCCFNSQPRCSHLAGSLAIRSSVDGNGLQSKATI